MMQHDPIVIVGSARTPMGGFQGDLKDATAPELGAAAIRAALERGGVSADAVEETCDVAAGGTMPSTARSATLASSRTLPGQPCSRR